ncbi:MAG: short-chain-enoyl-CoA hydratase [Solirubrobacterales bacterium]
MAFNNLILEKEGDLAILTINRPAALNALNSETLAELEQVVDGLAADASVKVVIVTGAGEKAFVAGADIAFMQPLTAVEGKKFGELGQRVFRKIEKLPQAVIAAVNGFALGGGCELAMSCDIRVASEKAKFGQPEVGLGITPGFGGTQRLARLIGEGMAKELIFTADVIDANEALRVGLVNHVIPPAELMDYCKAMAGRILAKGPLAVQFSKQAINEGMQVDIDRAMTIEADLFGLCFATEDQKEGMSAFVEKRKPAFKEK